MVPLVETPSALTPNARFAQPLNVWQNPHARVPSVKQG
jgi:hypothetical protein